MAPGSREEVVTPNLLVRRVGLLLGPLLFITLVLLGPPEGLSAQGLYAGAMTVWMAIWWMTEAVPIPATSLLPLVLLPLMGAADPTQVASNYARPIIFLFIGGFVLALAVEHWGLHRRLALGIIRFVGTSPDRLVLGFMVAAAFLSMWISNTATAMLLAPMALAVLTSLKPHLLDAEQERRFGSLLLLSVAYACSIGGVATLIGTPPNLILAAALATGLGIEVTFIGWMAVATPLAAASLAATWWYLVRRAFVLAPIETSAAAAELAREQAELGPWTWPQKAVTVVMSLVALSWIARPFLINPWLPQVDDAVIAIGGAISLFVIPANLRKGEFLFDWEMAGRLPWGLVFLFGGGLAIADGFATTGLSEWLVLALAGMGALPTAVSLVLIILTVVLLTEVSSNTASATLLMPVMRSLAALLGFSPAVLMTGAALSASCSFMLPVATPPNAIIFGTGKVSMGDMIRVGLWVNIGSVVVVSLVSLLLLPLIWPVGR